MVHVPVSSGGTGQLTSAGDSSPAASWVPRLQVRFVHLLKMP